MLQGGCLCGQVRFELSEIDLPVINGDGGCAYGGDFGSRKIKGNNIAFETNKLSKCNHVFRFDAGATGNKNPSVIIISSICNLSSD